MNHSSSRSLLIPPIGLKQGSQRRIPAPPIQRTQPRHAYEGVEQLHRIQPNCTKSQRRRRDHSLKTIAISDSRVAAAATRASSGPQIECCSQPRNSGSVPTILPRGGACSCRFETARQPVASNSALKAQPIHGHAPAGNTKQKQGS